MAVDSQSAERSAEPDAGEPAAATSCKKHFYTIPFSLHSDTHSLPATRSVSGDATTPVCVDHVVPVTDSSPLGQPSAHFRVPDLPRTTPYPSSYQECQSHRPGETFWEYAPPTPASDPSSHSEQHRHNSTPSIPSSIHSSSRPPYSDQHYHQSLSISPSVSIHPGPHASCQHIHHPSPTHPPLLRTPPSSTPYPRATPHSHLNPIASRPSRRATVWETHVYTTTLDLPLDFPADKIHIHLPPLPLSRRSSASSLASGWSYGSSGRRFMRGGGAGSDGEETGERGIGAEGKGGRV